MAPIASRFESSAGSFNPALFAWASLFIVAETVNHVRPSVKLSSRAKRAILVQVFHWRKTLAVHFYSRHFRRSGQDPRPACPERRPRGASVVRRRSRSSRSFSNRKSCRLESPLPPIRSDGKPSLIVKTPPAFLLSPQRISHCEAELHLHAPERRSP